MLTARFCGLLAALLLIVMPHAVQVAEAAEADGQRAVLVTGASTGIGRKIVEAVRLDVTVQADIDAAVEQVSKGGRGLYGLINNAGVFIGGPLVDVPVDELHWLMDINVYGVVRATQAFAPMIIESKGRISTVGSISGILSGRFSGHYSMSKHAVEAFTDSLAAEMEELGVGVSVIEPGNYNSAIAVSAQNRMRAKLDEYARAGSPFAAAFGEWVERDWDRSVYKEPDEVAAAALHAMSADEPLRRYMVVPKEEEAGWTIGKQIEELVQLNEGQEYSYTRDQLVEMLDAALAGGDDE